MKKVFIASVLKPVDDVRNFQKLATSLAKANKYQIFIFGKGSYKISQNPTISFIPLGNFQRFSISRLTAQFKIVRHIFKHRPRIVIITALELLPIIISIKIFYPVKIVYDIQEDYLKNIKHQKEYSTIEKIIGLFAIKLIQQLTFSKIDHFFCAEKTYAKDVLKNYFNKSVLENKTSLYSSKHKAIGWKLGEELRIVFSGTISEYSGVFNAISIFKKINEHYPNVIFNIIGNYHQGKIYQQLIRYTQSNPKIILNIDSSPIPHDRIMKSLSSSHAAIVGYLPDEVNKKRLPTKIFEYSALDLPFIFHKHAYWTDRASQLGYGIPCDFTNPNVPSILKHIENPNTSRSESPFWVSESEAINNIINSLI